MALKTYTQDATYSDWLTCRLIVTENSTDTTNNTSSCTATLQLIVAASHSFSAAYIGWGMRGDTGSQSGGGTSGSYGAGTHTLMTVNYTKAHNTDGTGTTTVNGIIDIPYFSWYAEPKVNKGALTPIPRYTSITSFTVSQRNETSLTVNWKTADTIDYLWYKYKPSGGSWTDWIGYNTADGTSNSFNVGSLTANTKYYFTLKVRRKDSQLETEWSGTNPNQTTHQYPYVKSIGTSDLNVGASTLTQTFKLYNPLNRNVTVYMKLADNTVINCGSTTNSTDDTYTYTFTTANKNAMNSSITNTTLTKNATYYCTYSSQTVSTVSGKYHIDSNDTNYKPTFSTSNWSYTTNYVKNDTVVANKSTITVNVSTSATPKTGATITGYTIKWGNQTKTITGTTGSVTTGADSATTLKVIANDSRGFTTEISRTIPVIAYTDPTCNIDADRTDGVGSDVFLSLDGTYKVVQLYTNSTTKTDNTILSVKYAISTTASYATDYTIPLSSVTINNGSYSLNNYQIYSNGSSTGFTVGTRYNIRIKIQDRYQTKEFTGTITDGKLAVDCYQDSNGDYHRGINGLGNDDYADYVHGDFGTEGRVYQEGSPVFLPSGNGTDPVYWCSLPNGTYMHSSTDGVTNMPASWGYVMKDGTYNADGTKGDFTVIFQQQSTGKICRTSGNANTTTCVWKELVYTDGTVANATNWNGLIDDHGTVDTTDTWIPVYNSSKMQHTLRAIWNSKQHTNHGTNKEYLATLSTLSYWNGAYDSSGTSNLTYAHQGEIQCKPTILYNNDSGTDGNFSLSESAANFNYLVFFYKNNDGDFGSTMIYDAYSKVIVLSANHNNDTYAYIKGRNYTIWNTAVNVKTSGYQARIGNNVATTFSTGSTIYVTRVIGYK